jgi:hypothetical protein
VRRISRAIAVVIIVAPLARGTPARSAESTTLDLAQRTFYNGRYADAAAMTVDLCTSEAATLAACELRSTALLFQLRRALGDYPDKNKAFAECDECATLLSVFVADTRRVQAVARTRLGVDPQDQETMFFLGKLNLNYVWLQLGTLGRKTGWDEYWEARRSLDKVLKQNPHHIRAKVARAWIDYIVDTKMPRGTRWLLGGGNRTRGLQAVREAAAADADLFVRAEAAFALWDMQVRERNIPGALATAATLVQDFPANSELRKFLDAHANTVSQ